MSHPNPTAGPLARFDPAGLYRAREFEAAGIHRSQLARLVEQGEIERGEALKVGPHHGHG